MPTLRHYPAEPVGIVHGFLPCDALPDAARGAGLTRRIAVVTETSHPREVDATLDEELYVRTIACFVSSSGATALEVHSDEGGACRVSTLDRVVDLFVEQPAPREPFPLVVALVDDRAVAHLVSEPWVQVGGPDPYHDSYTFALYASRDICSAFEGAFAAAMRDRVLEVRAYVGVPNAPQPRSVWHWFLRLVGLASLFAALVGAPACAERRLASPTVAVPSTGVPDTTLTLEEASFDIVTACVESGTHGFRADVATRSPSSWSGRVTSFEAIEDPYHRYDGAPIRAYLDYQVAVRNLGSSVEVVALPTRVRAVAGTRFAPGPHGCSRTMFFDAAPSGWETSMYLPSVRRCVEAEQADAGP